MRLPFAVYTANDGYGWSSGLAHGRGLLEQLRRAVGKTPDFDYGAPPCCGAVNDGDTVVVYKFMRAERWDSKGRNAAYLALCFFPRAQAPEVDFERLLELVPFVKPMREPPEWLEYADRASASSSFDPDSAGPIDAMLELACAGAAFVRPFAGTLRVSRDESAVGRGPCRMTYRRALASSEVTASLPVSTDTRRVADPPSPATESAVAARPPRFFLRAAVAAAVLALFVGGVCWRVGSAKNGERRCAAREVVCEKCGCVERGGNNCRRLFDVDGHWLGVLGCLRPRHGEADCHD